MTSLNQPSDFLIKGYVDTLPDFFRKVELSFTTAKLVTVIHTGHRCRICKYTKALAFIFAKNVIFNIEAHYHHFRINERYQKSLLA